MSSKHQIPSDDYPEAKYRTSAIFLISVLGLFLEMLLIRWIGTEVRIFAYLQNTILVACFLGLGLGSFTSRHPIHFRQMLIPLAFLVFLISIPITRSAFRSTSELLSVLDDLLIWFSIVNSSPLIKVLFVVVGLALTYSLLILIVDIFIPIGRLLGRALDEHPHTIWAYSVNIAGSLLGTWMFVLVSYFNQPPNTWFLLSAVPILVFIFWSKQGRALNLLLVAVIVLLSWFAGSVPDSLQVVWSPYQKLVVREANPAKVEIGDFIVDVNNVGYQMMADLSEDREGISANWKGLSQYDIPLLLHPNPKKYLIVGAGSGNDAAGGLRQGVEAVVAVEIDPAIISIGRRWHPENPYASSKVKVVNDDARSFFSTSQEKFDVISFGLLDSHTTNTMTNARLDHYVYTRESISRARSLLAEGGIMVLTFEAQKPYIADRMSKVLLEVFETAPIAFRIPPNVTGGWGGIMFIAGDLSKARQQISNNPRLSAFIEWSQREFPLELPHNTKVITDNWPYVYLESPKIPLLYYLLAGLMALVFVRSIKRWQATSIKTHWQRSHWHFFFLGAAFLLLEVQNISKASIILGNTWQVNAVIVSGVLVMALLANWIAYQFPKIRIGLVYVALIGTCLILYGIDLAQFAALPNMYKIIVVGGLTTLPMLFSGIIFIRSFSAVTSKNEALGANLVGSIAGALLQSITFLIGIKALLLIVAGLYLLSYLTIPSDQEHEKLVVQLKKDSGVGRTEMEG